MVQGIRGDSRLQTWAADLTASLPHAAASLVLVAARGAGFVASVATGLLFARLSTPRVFGEYQYVMSLLGAAGIFALPGMSVAIARAAARGHDAILLHCTAVRLRSSVLGVVVLLGIAVVFALRGKPSLAQGVLIAAVLFPLVAALDGPLAYLNGKARFCALAVAQTALALLPVTLVAAALLLRAGLAVTLLAALGATAFLNLALMRLTTSGHSATRDPDDLEAVRYGRRISGVYIIGLGHAHLAGLVVGTVLGPAPLASFAVAMLWAELFKQVMQILNVQLFPRLAGASDAEASRLLNRGIVRGFLPLLAVGFAAAALLPWLLPLVFTETYREGIPAAQLLIAGTILSYPGSQINNYFAARARTRAQYQIAASALLFEALGLALAVRWGLVGVAAVKGLVRTWYSVYGWWLLRHGA